MAWSTTKKECILNIYSILENTTVHQFLYAFKIISLMKETLGSAPEITKTASTDILDHHNNIEDWCYAVFLLYTIC